MAASVFERVESLLNQQGIVFQVLRHEPVYTSEEAARVRGTSLASGAKALIVKGEEGFVMFVVPADRKLDSHAVRRAKGWKKMRFATREEVLELTGLTPGSIPPFGRLFDLPTHCDQRLGENEIVNFNAGDHAISVSMRYPWGSKAGAPEPKVWQHDLFRKDRTPYDPREIELFKQAIAHARVAGARIYNLAFSMFFSNKPLSSWLGKFSADGSRLIFGTCLGAGKFSFPRTHDVALDHQGNR